MKISHTLLIAVAGFALAAPLQTASASSNSDADAEGAGKPKEKVICKRETNVGSRFPVKTCRSESEWKAENERGRRKFEGRDKDD